jgi:hypothetical protein
MLKRFSAAIANGDLGIISMQQEGDGAQKLELFQRPAEKVLHELPSDIQLAGCQHFGFKEYNPEDPHGNRLFAGHSMRSVSFSGRREPLILSQANRFGTDPPFRIVLLQWIVKQL